MGNSASPAEVGSSEGLGGVEPENDHDCPTCSGEGLVRLRAPRWRDVADELPQEAQEVLFVRDGKTVHGAWIGGIFWHSNQKMAAAYWMPLPLPPNAGNERTAD